MDNFQKWEETMREFVLFSSTVVLNQIFKRKADKIPLIAPFCFCCPSTLKHPPPKASWCNG